MAAYSGSFHLGFHQARRLSAVTYVQRTETVGGIAPSTLCSATSVGAVHGSNYSAEYSFYRAAS